MNSAAADWTHWRGPAQNGVAPDRDLPEKFSADPKAKDNNLVWKVPYPGRSTPVVANGKVYIINKVDDGLLEQERVLCFDAATGKVLWEHRMNVFHTAIVSVRLGWTNPVVDPETGNVYVHGTQGLLLCLDGKTGKVLWQHSLTEEYGRISGYGGRVTSPIIDENLLILGLVNSSWGELARGGNRFVAFDKKTGDVVWWASTGLPVKDTYYSVPVVAVINGQRLLISGGGDGAVHAFKVRTGEKVWSYLFGAGAVNCSPVVAGNFVYIGHGEENLDNNLQGRVICLDASQVKDGKPKLVWQADEIKAKFASPIIHEGRLYVWDDGGSLYCLDAAKGTELWKEDFGRDCKGSPVWADGKIYIAEVDGKFHILKPGADGCQPLHAVFFRSPDPANPVKIYGSPAVANGRIYFCTSSDTFCIGKPNPAPPSGEHRGATDGPAGRGDKAAHLQVVPADVILEPGQSAQFKVRAFNDKGQFLREEKAQWSLAPTLLPEGVKPAGGGPPALAGEITADGKLTAAKAPPGQFGSVVAKVGDLTGRARVRVVPTPPFSQDFEKVPAGNIPSGWVNAAGKFVVRKVGDTNVLVKLADNASPLLSRVNTYFGRPTLTDYTIQADVMGTQKGSDRPDMGVVANRYTLMLEGKTQTLRLVSWEGTLRVEKAVAWPWKPDAWYRLKLTVDVQKDKAVIRGKAWPRDQAEPTDWAVEFEDPRPNREGAPGLYGYALGIGEKEIGTEIFYDNVSVTPNKK